MARLSKKQLLTTVEHAICESGWDFFWLSRVGAHPATYQMHRPGQSHRVRVYIWNLTPGGKNRPTDEWRIQATGVSRFGFEPNCKTLILDWQNELGVFAGFDSSLHQGKLGASPSIQIRKAALDQATLDGFAPQGKSNSELVIAFRPEFFGAYVDSLESLHACGAFPDEIDILSRIGRDPDDVDDEEVARTIAEPRRYAVVSTRQAIRDRGFRNRVLQAYKYSCAMCGIQLSLIEGAHILPVEHPESTDGTDNGVALCALHHRAFDRALVTFDSRFRIRVNQKKIENLETQDLADGLASFTTALRTTLALPADKHDRPDRRFIRKANSIRGWRI